MTVLYVALGGAIGAALRYLLMVNVTTVMGTAFPYGTLLVNIIGSCLIGVLIGYLAKTLPHSMEMRAFLAIGVLGGFTTFSAFSLDVVTLFENGEFTQAGVYILSSVIISILALFAGLYLMRSLI